MKKLLALVLTLCMALSLCVCGQSTALATGTETAPVADQDPAAEETPPETDGGEAAEDAAADGDATAAMPDFSMGTPWADSCVTGFLLPEDEQNLKDDFYQAVNYEWLAERQDTLTVSAPTSESEGLASRFLTYLFDDTNTGDTVSNIRIFFDQAADTDTLLAQGMEPVQKYLDLIDSATTLEEFNAVLSSEDYPFDAFVKTDLRAHYMDGNNVIGIQPHFFAVDDSEGASYYRDYPIDFTTNSGFSIIQNSAVTLTAFVALGYSWNDESKLYCDAIRFESSYGKDAPYDSEVSKVDYDKADTLVTYVTLDELQARMGSFPIRGILSRLGQDTSELYYVGDIAWLDSFAAVYTEENLDMLKLIAKLQLLKEATPYTCLSYADVNETLMQDQLVLPESMDVNTIIANAYSAVSASNTYGQAVGSIYKNEILSQSDYDRLYGMSETMIEEYREIITANTWMSETSKENVLKKLDAITLNIMEPEGGYISYDGVEMKSSEDGGTLLENYLTLKDHFAKEYNKLINTPALAVSCWISSGPAMGNAFYDQDSNSINILPGIICDATYRADMSDEELYGSIGDIIAHEISHAFDYSGSRYNEVGEPKTIFTSEDLETFLGIQQKLMDYYDAMSIADAIPVDGRLIVTEAGADLSGMQVINRIAASRDDFDYDVYYRAVASLYAHVLSPTYAILFSADVHPSYNLRVNARVCMFDSFYDTYGIEEGDGMYLAPADRITVW